MELRPRQQACIGGGPPVAMKLWVTATVASPWVIVAVASRVQLPGRWLLSKRHVACLSGLAAAAQSGCVAGCWRSWLHIEKAFSVGVIVASKRNPKGVSASVALLGNR